MKRYHFHVEFTVKARSVASAVCKLIRALYSGRSHYYRAKVDPNHFRESGLHTISWKHLDLTSSAYQLTVMEDAGKVELIDASNLPKDKRIADPEEAAASVKELEAEQKKVKALRQSKRDLEKEIKRLQTRAKTWREKARAAEREAKKAQGGIGKAEAEARRRAATALRKSADRIAPKKAS